MAEETQKPLTRDDVLKAIEENGGKAEGLDFSEKHFQEGINLWGLNLKRANLEYAHLEKALLEDANLEGALLAYAHLEGATLMIAHLEGAFLEGVHLEGADLAGAHLEGAYLKGAYLEGAYLEDAIFSPETRLEEADWGNFIMGEERELQFGTAAATYRQLKTWHTHAGYSDIAAKFYYREREANRKSLKLRSKHWNDRLAAESMRALFGYGERWWNILFWIAGFILLFALIYCAIGSVWDWSAFGSSLYFSAVSFTALGYGSWVQVTNNWIKGIGAFESLAGVFMMALLLVTFVRKWTR